MIGVDWASVAWGTVGSAIVGVILWLFLPRGVVLTREHPVRNEFTGEIQPDTWRIRNSSPITARVTSIRVTSFTRADERRTWWRRAFAWPFKKVMRLFPPKEFDAPYPLWRRRAHALSMRLAGVGEPRLYIDLPSEPAGEIDYVVDLSFDDETLEIGRTDNQMPWKWIEIPPGEMLTAHVVGMTSMLDIRYRRAGLFGIGERRRIRIFGYA